MIIKNQVLLEVNIYINIFLKLIKLPKIHIFKVMTDQVHAVCAWLTLIRLTVSQKSAS